MSVPHARSRRLRTAAGAVVLSVVLLLAAAGPKDLSGRASAQAPTSTFRTSYVLRPERVFDGVDGKTHEGWVVAVDGNRISAIGAAAQIKKAPSAELIELPGMTLLPGLMDIHSHIFLHPYNETAWDDQVIKEPLAYRTIKAVQHLRATLLSGFTLLRDMGTEGAGYADLSIQRALDEGLIPGPRLLVATLAIVATASYGPGPLGFIPDIDLPKGAQEASGNAEVLKAVREQAGHGADWIKVYADYRRGPRGAAVPTFSEEELHTLVQESHSAGRLVASHAATAEGMRRSIIAGASTIEHGYGGTAEVFQLMAKNQVAYLPTLTAGVAYAEYFDNWKPGQPPTPAMQQAERAFKLALENGVTIGLGSDVGVFAHGANYRELEWMVRYGMKPQQALLAATAVNARILRMDGQIGQLRPGLLADIIAIEGNPAENIDAVRHVRFVMKDGIIFKR